MGDLPKLAGRIDTLSISLNGSTEEEYVAVTRPQSGAAGWEAMLDFTRKAAEQVPHVVMTVVNKDKSGEEIDRCRALAEGFPHSLIIQGDGTDPELLEEEL